MKRRSFYDLIFNNWPAKVLSISIAVILFLLYRLATQQERFFNIPLAIIVNEEYIPAGNYPKRVRITLKGQENDIFLVMDEDIEAETDLSGYVNEGIYKAPVLVRKTGAAATLQNVEIRVDPIEITVALEQKIRKSLEVFPTLKGNPTEGYSLRQFVISPTYVEAEGPRSALQDITTVRTEDIDLTAKSDTFTLRVRLDSADKTIIFPGGDIVEFTAVIEESISVQNFQNIDLSFADLQENLVLTTPRFYGSIQLQGNFRQLKAISADDLKLTADCSEIKAPGVYEIEVEPTIPEAFRAINFYPRTITVQAVLKDEP